MDGCVGGWVGGAGITGEELEKEVCFSFYIPCLSHNYRAHHVRSYNQNVAVNLWWKEGLNVNFSTCNMSPVTFKGLLFIGFGGLYESQYRMIK